MLATNAAPLGVAPRRTAALAELTDLYRTLVDVAGLPPPAAAVQGASLASVRPSGQKNEQKLTRANVDASLYRSGHIRRREI